LIKPNMVDGAKKNKRKWVVSANKGIIERSCKTCPIMRLAGNGLQRIRNGGLSCRGTTLYSSER